MVSSSSVSVLHTGSNVMTNAVVGAANHLWAEYVRGHPKYVNGDPTLPHVTNRLLIKDVAFLAVFGLFAELMCYATSPQAFFLAGLVFLVVAFAWSLLHLQRSS